MDAAMAAALATISPKNFSCYPKCCSLVLQSHRHLRKLLAYEL